MPNSSQGYTLPLFVTPNLVDAMQPNEAVKLLSVSLPQLSNGILF